MRFLTQKMFGHLGRRCNHKIIDAAGQEYKSFFNRKIIYLNINVLTVFPQLKIHDIVFKPVFIRSGQEGTPGRQLNAFRDSAGKHQAGGLIAPTTIGPGQAFEYFNDIGPCNPRIAGLYRAAILPGRINLPDKPFQYLVRLLVILEGIDSNLSGMDCNQPAH
jgi:hypothetical protein